MRTDPHESSTDSYRALSNGVGVNAGDKLAAIAIDSLNKAIAFIINPDRSRTGCEGTRSPVDVDRCDDPIGGRINLVQFIVSGSCNPDGTKSYDDARASGWEGNRRFYSTTFGGIPPHLIVAGDCPNGTFANCDCILADGDSSP